MADNLMAKEFYSDYRQKNKNLFSENLYLFFPEHYLDLSYSLNNKPDLSSKKFLSKWNKIIKQQENLENTVLNTLNISFEELQKQLFEYKESKQEKEIELQFNLEAKRIIENEIEIFLNENSRYFDIEGGNKVTDLLVKNLTVPTGRLANKLDILYTILSNKLDGKLQADQNRVTRNVLSKILNYQYVSLENIEAGKREKRNIDKKKYTINKIFDSIKKSAGGTINNLKSSLDETIVMNFLNNKNFNIDTSKNKVIVNAIMPTGGKKVKADIRATITTDSPFGEETKINFGISNKIGNSNIKLHSGGNLNAFTKWISAYKGTNDITNFLKSNEFKFMLANEINADKKGEAWNTFQQILRASLYIWLGNEFVMRDNEVARKLFGEKVGNYNIAFIISNKKLYKISSILINIRDRQFSSSVSVNAEKRSEEYFWSEKRRFISTLPTYSEYINQTQQKIGEFPYPSELLTLGRKGTLSLLNRFSYNIIMNKNLLTK